MAISMLLVSCSTPNTSYDDEVIEVSTPTNNPNGDNENTDNGSDVAPTENGTNGENPTNDEDTTPSGDTDNGSDVTNNTDVNYFELENDENYLYDFTYKVSDIDGIHDTKFTSDNNLTFAKGTKIVHIQINDTKVKFTDNDVHNVTVDRTTSPKFTVTIELVDNN